MAVVGLKFFRFPALFSIIFLINFKEVQGNHLLFDINKDELRIDPVILSGKSDKSHFKRTKDGKSTFAFEGSISEGTTWFIPINARISSLCEIQFEVSSRNIRTYKNSSNIFLALHSYIEKDVSRASFDGETEILTQKLSIFKAAGPKDIAIGRLPINPKNGDLIIDGLFIDLGLRESGIGELTLSTLTLTFQGNLPEKEEIDRILSIPPPVTALVKDPGWGKPALIVNGVEQYGIGFSPGRNYQSLPYSSEQEESSPFINRVILNFGGENSLLTNFPPLWNYQDYIDFSQIDRLISNACFSGQNYVVIEVLLQTPPKWWLDGQQSIPGGSVSSEKFRSGPTYFQKGSNIEYTETKTPGSENKKLFSDKNPAWIEYCENALRYLLFYIRERPYSPYIIGCSVILGVGRNDFAYPNRDLHPNYILSFQNWLKEKYGTVSDLRKAWGAKNIDFINAFPLARNKWNKGDVYSFIHPKNSSHPSDSRAYFDLSWSRSLIHFSKLVKSLTQGRFISGLVGGPGLIFNNLWNNEYKTTSAAILSILKSEYIDYIDIPLDSTDLRIGYGSNGLETILNDELSRSNKILFIRNDLSYPDPSRIGTRPKDLEEAIQNHRRVFTSCLTNRAYVYYLLSHKNQYSNDTFVKELGTFQEISTKTLKLSNRKLSETAFVVDFEAFRYLAPDRRQPILDLSKIDFSKISMSTLPYISSEASNYFYLFTLPRLTWNRLGVPYDVVDINNLDPHQYKTLIFFHTFYLTDKINNILNSCKNSGRTLVSIWANGFVSDRFLSPIGIEKFTGMKVQQQPGKTRFILSGTSELENYMNRHLLSSSLGWLYTFREPNRHSRIHFNPMFTVNDDKAIILANYVDGNEPALAVKKFPEWTSVYSASPVINPDFLRSVLVKSGVHLYLDSSDICSISDSYIGISTLKDGVREIRLPKESFLFEVFDKQELGKEKIHQVELQAKKTYLFFLGDKETWDGL